MELNIRYKRLPLEERASIIKEIEVVLESIDLTKYPLIQQYLSDADGRLALLQKTINIKFASPELSYEDAISNIENTQD